MSEEWWPNRKRRDMTDAAQGGVRFFATFDLTKRQIELCLFHRHAVGDALHELAGRAMAGLPVRASELEAAIAVLESGQQDGAMRLAQSLRRTLEASDRLDQTWLGRHDLPASVIPRHAGKRKLKCSYVLEHHSQIKCENWATYNITGTSGSFCEIHARRTAIRVERRKEAAARSKALGEQRRAASEQKKNAGTPTSST